MANTARDRFNYLAYGIRCFSMYQMKNHKAPIITPMSGTHRTRILLRGIFLAARPSAVKTVRSAPQCGQISVASLISLSHSRQVYMERPKSFPDCLNQNFCSDFPADWQGTPKDYSRQWFYTLSGPHDFVAEAKDHCSFSHRHSMLNGLSCR